MEKLILFLELILKLLTLFPLIKKEKVTLETAEGEKVIYYEVFHGNKLQERYLDTEYQRTTPEYANEFENFCKYGVQGLTF